MHRIVQYIIPLEHSNRVLNFQEVGKNDHRNFYLLVLVVSFPLDVYRDDRSAILQLLVEIRRAIGKTGTGETQQKYFLQKHFGAPLRYALLCTFLRINKKRLRV